MSSLATGVTGFLALYHLWAGLFRTGTSIHGLGERLGWLWTVYIVVLERFRSSLLRGQRIGADYGYSSVRSIIYTLQRNFSDVDVRSKLNEMQVKDDEAGLMLWNLWESGSTGRQLTAELLGTWFDEVTVLRHTRLPQV